MFMVGSLLLVELYGAHYVGALKTILVHLLAC